MKNSGGFGFAVVFAAALVQAMSSFAATQYSKKGDPSGTTQLTKMTC